MVGGGTVPAARAHGQTTRFPAGVGGSLREFWANSMQVIEFSGKSNLFVPSLAVVGVIQEHFKVSVCKCPLSGVISEEEWRDHNGLLHRWDEPAITRRDRDSGVVTERSFCWRDQLHRTNGEPAQLLYEERSGQLIRRAWLVHGEYSRLNDLPHVELLDERTGNIVRAEYRIRMDGGRRSALHRETGPALLLFDRISGQKTDSAFYRFGRKQGGTSVPAQRL